MAMLAKFGAVAAVGLLVAGCTNAAQTAVGPDGLTVAQGEILTKELAGKTPGAPVRCLNGGQRYDTIRVSDDVLLYRASGRVVYRTNLRGSCPGLARDNDIMVVRQYGSGTCSGDFFHLVDRSSGMRGPTCVFGEFIPYRTGNAAGR